MDLQIEKMQNSLKNQERLLIKEKENVLVQEKKI